MDSLPLIAPLTGSLTGPLVLTIVTGVSLVLATTAIVLAQDAPARAVAPRAKDAEDIVPHPAASQNPSLRDSPRHQQMHHSIQQQTPERTLEEPPVTPEPVATSGAR
jgi:hypothetical protein